MCSRGPAGPVAPHLRSPGRAVGLGHHPVEGGAGSPIEAPPQCQRQAPPPQLGEQEEEEAEPELGAFSSPPPPTGHRGHSVLSVGGDTCDVLVKNDQRGKTTESDKTSHSSR